MIEMKVDEGGLQGQKSHERNEKGEVGGSATKRFKTDPPFPNDKSTDPGCYSILEKVEKEGSKGFKGIYIFPCPFKEVGYYRRLRVDYNAKGRAINILNYNCVPDSLSHEVDIQYLKLLKDMIDDNLAERLGSISFNLQGHLWNMTPKYELLSFNDIDNCFEDYTFINQLKKGAEQSRAMYNALLCAKDDEKDECSKDSKEYAKKLRNGLFPVAAYMMEKELCMIGEMWKIKQEDWEGILKSCMLGSVEDMENSFVCRLERWGYTKADYIKQKLEVARKLGIITEIDEVDDDVFLPQHEIPDLD